MRLKALVITDLFPQLLTPIFCVVEPELSFSLVRPFGNPRWWIAGRKRFLGSFLNRIGILRQLAGIWRSRSSDFWRGRFCFSAGLA